MKYAKGDEIKVIQSLNEKLMSDEETDTEDSKSFIKRSPLWRCEKLNALIKKLDKRHLKKKNNSKPSKERRVGPESGRPAPSNAPSWAIVTSTTVTHTESGHDDDMHMPLSTSLDIDDSIGITASSSKNASDSSDSESDPEFENWIQQATTSSA